MCFGTIVVYSSVLYEKARIGLRDDFNCSVLRVCCCFFASFVPLVILISRWFTQASLAAGAECVRAEELRYVDILSQ